jgi:hypothetical protein
VEPQPEAASACGDFFHLIQLKLISLPTESSWGKEKRIPPEAAPGNSCYPAVECLFSVQPGFNLAAGSDSQTGWLAGSRLK